MLTNILNTIQSLLMNFNKKDVKDEAENSIQTSMGLDVESKEERLDITIDKNIRTKYKKGWINKIRKNDPEEIVLHGTGGGNTAEGILRWMYDGERSHYYNKGVALFHYLIAKGGKIIEVIDPNYWVYHSTSGSHAKVEIGIELLNSSKSNRDPYTDAQYEALFNLIEELFKLYPSITRISSHRYNILKYNSPSTAKKYLKQCPGPGFKWEKLSTFLTKEGYTFKTDGNLHYNIGKKG